MEVDRHGQEHHGRAHAGSRETITTTIAHTNLVAMLIFTIVFMFLIGALTPVEYMLPTSQYVAHALPPTYGVDALRRIMLLGQGSPGSP